MFERFTTRARKVIALAVQEAQRLNHEYIGTEHMLLGLVAEGTGVGATVLKNLGVDLADVRREVGHLVKAGPEIVTMGNLPQTPWAKKVIEYAIAEADRCNHAHVGTEHLLLGLLREQDGVAAQVLRYLGLKVESVREKVVELAGDGLSRGASPPSMLTALGTGRDEIKLIHWLATHDAPCPVCSYNLRGLRQVTCPECGAPLHLAVGSENLNLGPWVLAIAGPILAMGFDGVVSLLMGLGLTFAGPTSPGARVWFTGVFGVFVALMAACGFGLWILLKRRRAWSMMPRRRQWVWAWAIFAVVGVVHAVYGLVLMMSNI